jgi:membrane protease subunit HflC
MKKTITVIVVLFVILLLFLLTGPFYVVDEGQQAVVVRFGRIIDVHRDAGLKLKVPFVDSVEKYSRKVLAWDGEAQLIPTRENQFIWVDTTARWRIVDPKLFYQSVGTMTQAQSRLDDVIDSTVRKVISRNSLVEAVRNSNVINEIKRGNVYLTESTPAGEQALALDVFTNVIYEKIEKGRVELSNVIFEESKGIMPQYGIELIDLLIRQIKYSDDLTESVYNRMIKERNQIAQAFRSDGEGKKAKRLGEMQRELRTIQSEAYRRSETIKGEADAKAAAIYAVSYNRNPEFYQFWKAVEAYRAVLPNFNKTLTTQPEFFDYLYNQRGR